MHFGLRFCPTDTYRIVVQGVWWLKVGEGRGDGSLHGREVQDSKYLQDGVFNGTKGNDTRVCGGKSPEDSVKGVQEDRRSNVVKQLKFTRRLLEK